jgi:peptide/nickel transport system permease protein
MNPSDPSLPAIDADALAREQTPFRVFLSNFMDSRLAVGGTAFFSLILVAAVFAPFFSPQNPYDLAQLNLIDSRLTPGSTGFEGMTYWLGTDDQGRDMLSGILYGLRTSLTVGVVSTVLALIVGTSLGIAAAFFGGRVDSTIMRVVDLQLSIPAILIALVLLAVLGRGLEKIIFALAVVQWAYYARTVRGVALVERRSEYVEAARCLALSDWRIAFRHIIPNCMAPLIVVGTIQVAHAITIEATLSFLGIGLPVTEPSLGLLIANGFAHMLNERYWISLFPGIALLITILSINLMGDQLRDVLNPRLHR